MSKPIMDWSTPTPRDPSPAQQAGNGSPPCGRQDAEHSPFASSRPLSFAQSGGDVIWQTYPGHLFLTVEQAEAVASLIAEEWTRTSMSGGGPCEAVSMLQEINTAIKAATRWRACGDA